MDKKNNSVKILLIILIMLVLCLIVLLAYKMLFFDNNNNSVENSNSSKETSSYESAYKLYSEFISLGNLCGGFRFPYLDDVSTRMLFTYDSIDSKLVKKFNFNSEKSFDKCVVYSEDDECLLETVKVSDFEKKYKNLFGSNSQIDYSSLPNNYSVKNGNINQYFRIFGCEGWVAYYSILEKYEAKDANLILYVKTLEISTDVTISQYDELLDYFDKNGIVGDNVSNDKLTDEDKKKMFEYYKDYVVSYKLSFSKDVDGNYYFTGVQKI